MGQQLDSPCAQPHVEIRELRQSVQPRQHFLWHQRVAGYKLTNW
jgi:hypothetical protein